MRKVSKISFLCLGILYCLCLCLQVKTVYAKTYTISPVSKPCNGTERSEKYNSHTKGYFLINSYLKKISEEKGGTLILKRGTYKISNTLYVSGNTHIILKDGAVLKKEADTKCSDMPAASSMFQFIDGDKAQKEGVYGKHNGEKNISVIGSGKAVIDLNYADMGEKDVIGIIMGHNQNITLKNITFKNMRYGHMIEMDACKNVKIKNCTFIGFKMSGKSNKEAINLDTPDKKRNGFKSKWSKMDGTPNENVTITGCTFEKLEAGIGTHRYTGDSYHKNVTIKDCTFEKVQTAIRVLNWKDAVITKNSFKNCIPNDRYLYSFFIAGAKGLTFSENTFDRCGNSGKYLLEFWCNRGYAANQTIYPATTSKITKKEAEFFLTNTAKNCGSIHVMDCPFDIDFTQKNQDKQLEDNQDNEFGEDDLNEFEEDIEDNEFEENLQQDNFDEYE